MPAALPVTAIGMNYGSAVFVAGLGIALAWYYIWGRKNYAGPRDNDALAAGEISPPSSYQ